MKTKGKNIANWLTLLLKKIKTTIFNSGKIVVLSYLDYLPVVINLKPVNTVKHNKQNHLKLSKTSRNEVKLKLAC